MTSPTHLYRHCDDFHQKNIDKLVQDQFLQPVKDHPCDKFGYVDISMPCFFLQKGFENFKFLKIREHHSEHFEKTLSVMFLGFE